MPLSMTGFAATTLVVTPFELNWELRSVNHRFLDIRFRLPDELRHAEPEYRDVIASGVNRGRLECTLNVTALTAEPSISDVDAETLAGLARLQDAVRNEVPDAKPFSIAELLRWPGVLKAPELTALIEPAKRCLTEALKKLRRARRREGDRIAELLADRCDTIASLASGVRPLLASAEQGYRDKLTERLERLDVQATPGRLEQELVLVAQRLDVTEEVDRLDAHIAEIRDVLGRDEPVGRRLDFLIQELNREANTLASKAQDAQLTRSAVDIKVLIEQMREQVQNLE